MKLFTRPNGIITSHFAGLEEHRESPHNGIDFWKGFKTPITAIADGFIYKITNKNSKDVQKYRQVHQIVDTPLGPMEVVYVHVWDIWVSEGDRVLVGQPICTEGNTGTEVYFNGVKVKKEEKESGKGSHLHLCVRPVIRTKKTKSGEHYLNKASGSKYKDTEGNYYQIAHADNGTTGYVDFMQWLYVPTEQQVVFHAKQVALWFQNIINNNLFT